MLHMALSVAILTAGTPAHRLCSKSPDAGSSVFFGPLSDVPAFVDRAEVILRVRAADTASAEIRIAQGTRRLRQVRFVVLETLKGQYQFRDLAVFGTVVNHDEFNRAPVPYRSVRRSGLRGSCFTHGYKIGAEYLLLLTSENGTLTPYWAPLSPVNEQIRWSDDPWVRWIRSEIGTRDSGELHNDRAARSSLSN